MSSSMVRHAVVPRRGFLVLCAVLQTNTNKLAWQATAWGVQSEPHVSRLRWWCPATPPPKPVHCPVTSEQTFWHLPAQQVPARSDVRATSQSPPSRWCAYRAPIYDIKKVR